MEGNGSPTERDTTSSPADALVDERPAARRGVVVLWAVTATFLSLPFIVGIPHRWRELREPCRTDCADRLTLDEEHLDRLADIGVTARMFATWEVGRELVLATACIVLGTVLIRRIGSAVAFLTAMVLVAFGAVLVPEVPIAADRAAALPGAVDQAVWVLAMCTVAVPWFLLPTGRFVPRWGWAPALATMATWTALAFVDTEPPPVLLLAAIALLGFGIGAQVHRFRRASTVVERQQLKWLGIGLVGWMSTLAVYLVVDAGGLLDTEWTGLGYPLGRIAFGLAATGTALVFPFAWSMAILKHRLWDADRVLDRGTLAILLTAGSVIAYASTVFLVAAIADGAAGPVAAVVLVVAALLLRDPVRRRTTRLFYGQRDAPFELLAGLWSIANRSPANDATLAALTRRLVESLHLTAGRIEITGERGVVFGRTYGSPAGEPADVALEFCGEHVGVLRVWPRLGEAALARRDLQLITDASAPIAHLAASVRLTGDLRRSQAALIDAREEERRRIHRDLHDDLGPSLAGQALLLDAVGTTIDTDPVRARELAALAKRRTDDVVEHIRRLARDLRPTALDQLGLASSLRQAALVADSAHVRVEAEIDDLPDLPAATETAAYRIVTEGLTNALRHSDATTIRIRVGTSGGTLVAAVEDDGRGGAPTAPRANGHGVGLRSIHERAAQSGGRLTINSPPGGGTTVEVRLPTAVDG